MANQEHLEILKQGVDTWNKWRKENIDIQPDLSRANLFGIYLNKANLSNAILANAHLEGANLSEAHLEGANLKKAYLHGINLSNAHLEGANISEARMEGKIIPPDILAIIRQQVNDFPRELLPANLSGVFFDNTTNLKGVILGDSKLGGISLADAHFGDVSFSVVEWKPVKMLGDERKAQQLKEKDEKKIVSKDEINAYETAIRANRQLATTLQNQGLNEKASYFAYRAQVNQRHLLKLQVINGLKEMPLLRFLVYKPKKLANELKLFLLFTFTAFMLVALFNWVELLFGVPRFLQTILGNYTSLELKQFSYQSLLISTSSVIFYFLFVTIQES
jgi:uncharacterized protein YjbI with pentapeptide repeats